MKKNNMTKDALMFLPAKIIEGIILMLTTSSLYTAVLSESAYGTFQIINTSILFLYLLINGWLANACNRYIYEENRKDDGKTIYSTVFSIYLLVISVISIVCIGVYLYTEDVVYLLIILMYAAYTLFQIANGILVQLGKARQSIIYSLSSATLKFLVVVIVLKFVPSLSSSPIAPILAVIISDLFSGVLAIITLKIPTKFSIKLFNYSLLQKFLHYGVPLMGVSISVGLLNMIDRYLVVWKFGSDGFAAYSANYGIASGIFAMINVAIMRGVYPAVIKAYKEHGETETKKLLSAGARLYLLVAVPAMAGLFGISGALSKLLFVKTYYQSGSIIIGLTALSMVFMGLTEYANKSYELKATTFPVLQNSLVATIVKIISTLVFLNIFGIIGGALGSIFAFLTYFIITSIRARKNFVFSLSGKTIFNIAIAGVLCFVSAHIISSLNINLLLSIIFAITIGGIIYILSLIITGECKDEINSIKTFINKRRT